MPPRVEAWQDPVLLEEIARPYYRDDLEFHNWEHILAVRDKAREKAQLCVDNGLAIDWDVIDPASLYHDAGSWLVPAGSEGRKAEHRFKSPERYAASLAVRDLTELGMPEDKVKHVG